MEIGKPLTEKIYKDGDVSHYDFKSLLRMRLPNFGTGRMHYIAGTIRTELYTTFRINLSRSINIKILKIKLRRWK